MQVLNQLHPWLAQFAKALRKFREPILFCLLLLCQLSNSEAQDLTPDKSIKVKNRDIERFLRDTKSSQLSVKLKAVNWFGTLEVKNLSEKQQSQIINNLEPLFNDKDYSLRSALSRAMSRYGAAAIPSIRRCLQSKEYRRVSTALKTVENLGATAAPLTQDILRLHVKERSTYLAGPAKALGKIGPAAKAAIPSLVESLGDKRFHMVRDASRVALGQMGKEAVGPLVRLLENAGNDLDLMIDVLDCLEKIGGEAFEAIPFIQKTLADNRKEILIPALRVLQKVAGHPSASSTVPFVHKLLKHKEAQVRRCAASILGAVKKEQEKTVERLIEMFKDVDFSVREEAAKSLGRIGRVAAIPLRKPLNSGDPQQQVLALRALCTIKAKDKVFIQDLLNLLKSKSFQVQDLAAQALLQFGALVAPKLKEIAEGNRDKALRLWAISNLGKVDPGTKETLAFFKSLAGHEDPELRGSAATALGQFKYASKERLAVLQNLAKDRSSKVRSAVASAFGRSNLSYKQALPTLETLFNDKEISVRRAVIVSLGTYGQEAAEFVPGLIVTLKNKNWTIQLASINTLGSIGNSAKEALPLLKGFLKEARILRLAAKNAIQKIEKRE